MSKTKTDEERAFYLKLASKEKYKARELERQIDSGYYERLFLSNGKAPSGINHTENTGIILCKSKDEDVVEYALSRNMSSTMISEYRTKLISKEILQKKLEELYYAADESQNSQQC